MSIERKNVRIESRGEKKIQVSSDSAQYKLLERRLGGCWYYYYQFEFRKLYCLYWRLKRIRMNFLGFGLFGLNKCIDAWCVHSVPFSRSNDPGPHGKVQYLLYKGNFSQGRQLKVIEISCVNKLDICSNSAAFRYFRIRGDNVT